MKRLPEGVRRVSTVLGVLLIVCWLGVIGFVSDGFDLVEPMGWLVLGLVAVFAYLIPTLTYRIYRWVRDGFSMDAQR